MQIRHYKEENGKLSASVLIAESVGQLCLLEFYLCLDTWLLHEEPLTLCCLGKREGKAIDFVLFFNAGFYPPEFSSGRKRS